MISPLEETDTLPGGSIVVDAASKYKHLYLQKLRRYIRVRVRVTCKKKPMYDGEDLIY